MKTVELCCGYDHKVANNNEKPEDLKEVGRFLGRDTPRIFPLLNLLLCYAFWTQSSSRFIYYYYYTVANLGK